MLIGVPREIKVHEYRVGLTPESVCGLVACGHGVEQAIEANEHLRNGVNVCCGAVTRREVAESQELPYTDVMTALYGH